MDWIPGDPDPTRPAREPRKCRRHVWGGAFTYDELPADLSGYVDLPDGRSIAVGLGHSLRVPRELPGKFACARCGKVRDDTATRRGKSSRRLGNDQERRAERVYGWEKVGEFGGPEDLIGTLMIVQQKSTRAAAPKKWTDIFAALDRRAMGRSPALLLSYVRQGVPAEDFIVVRGKDWLSLFGKDKADADEG